MRKLVYRDLDEFAHSLAGFRGHFIPTSRQSAEWWIQRSDGHCHWLEAFQIGGSSTFAGQSKAAVVTLATPIAQLGQVRVNGHVLQPDELVLLQPHKPFTFSGQDQVCWAGITLSNESTLVAPELLTLQRCRGVRIRTAQAHLDRLRRMIRRFLTHLESADCSEHAAVALERELVLCLTRILEHSRMPSAPRRLTRPPAPRGLIIARALELIEAHQGEPLFVGDLCRAAGVSERTLRNIFYEFFGIGPMRLLKAIQLHNIRIALLRADPQHGKVTHIAAEYGVSDFSLFARNYKAIYGELPSVALQTPPSGERNKHGELGWLHYASRLVVNDSPDSSGDSSLDASAQHDND